MTVAELKEKLSLKLANELYDKDVESVFISDMVSDVMAGAKPGALWVTTQSHKNVVAAANLVDIAAVVVTRGKPVPADTIEMATRAELTIFTTDLETYDFIVKLHGAGV